MKIIRFELEGLLNSFRIPFFRTYHKTFLAPPKTTIIGMLCNISLKSQKEFFDILDKELIDVSVIIDEINGKTKDLWSYKTLEKGNMGKSVVRRDKLYLSKYTIYLHIKDEKLFYEALNFLKNPSNIPSLGLDDELVIIKNIEDLTSKLKSNDTNQINSVFLNKNYNYKAFIKEPNKPIELPTANLTPVKFIAFDKKGNRISKEVKEEFLQVEYINCNIQIDEISSYIDEEKNNKLVFY
ncbi:CRISPR-associated protein Cas5 [Arcobacter sp. CECT 9188]|uniref:CRISPR-associated protein Cas5 n=1 Tax=Arcobacter sp. CECT 9188 TaxID=2044505 RepID=UPI000DE8D2EE|nr:CRISPR-associated protein Cas5 [Arcobacter sp. CECT 9188]RBQ25783.1 CRISPR-associated protein Cas5 [Arcobacter sp. CECT 9188]